MFLVAKYSTNCRPLASVEAPVYNAYGFSDLMVRHLRLR